MLKVLVISFEPWRDDSNGGNVLSNIFRGQNVSLAQIYCKPGEPQNQLCRNYFHMTARMAIRSILRREPCGAAMEYPTSPAGDDGRTASDDEGKKLYSFFKLVNWPIFYVLRDLVMFAARWKSAELRRFVEDFQPDVIFAPLYASQFMLALDRYVIRLAQKPAVSYVSDDNYTLLQLRFSPVYWLDRFVLRRNVRQTVPLFSHVYTMTQEQAEQMHADLGCDMRILRKSMAVSDPLAPCEIHRPIRLIYAGGISFGREQTLIALTRAIQTLPAGSARLDIYTNSPLRKHVIAALTEGEICALHEAVPYERLMERYRESDLALHVESFRKKNALMAKYSFSTKIVDCLASGCAVLAVCPDSNAGFRFLKREDAAVCIDRPEQIEPVLKRILHDDAYLQEYRQKAHACMRKEFDPETIRNMLSQDLTKLARRAT